MDPWFTATIEKMTEEERHVARVVLQAILEARNVRRGSRRKRKDTGELDTSDPDLLEAISRFDRAG